MVQRMDMNDYSSFAGPSQQRPQNQENSAASRARNQNNVFQEKDFGDLIDTEKRQFVKLRIFQTLTGGYRLKLSEDEGLPWFLHVFQVLIYFIVPGLLIAIYFAMSLPMLENTDNTTAEFNTPPLIAGIIVGAIIGILHGVGYCVSKRR